MARRPLAGRDQKIIQGHRRDAFFAKMRRKGGVPRMPTQGATIAAPEEELDLSPTAEAEVMEEAAAETAAEQQASAAEAEETE